MNKIIAFVLVLASICATPVLADRAFGTSNQGPPVMTGASGN